MFNWNGRTGAKLLSHLYPSQMGSSCWDQPPDTALETSEILASTPKGSGVSLTSSLTCRSLLLRQIHCWQWTKILSGKPDENNLWLELYSTIFLPIFIFSIFLLMRILITIGVHHWGNLPLIVEEGFIFSEKCYQILLFLYWLYHMYWSLPQLLRGHHHLVVMKDDGEVLDKKIIKWKQTWVLGWSDLYELEAGGRRNPLPLSEGWS